MKRTRTLLLITCVSLLTVGCVSTRSGSIVKPAPRPIILAPDSALTKGCDLPVLLPDQPITQRMLEKLWISDRKALLVCSKRHKALGDFIKKQREALS